MKNAQKLRLLKGIFHTLYLNLFLENVIVTMSKNDIMIRLGKKSHILIQTSL